MTLSQVDSTVLDALPHDLRREVLSQLDARARLRQDTSAHNDHAREAPRALPAGVTGVRDGFDPTVREVSSKAQQVSGEMLRRVLGGLDVQKNGIKSVMERRRGVEMVL